MRSTRKKRGGYVAVAAKSVEKPESKGEEIQVNSLQDLEVLNRKEQEHRVAVRRERLMTALGLSTQSAGSGFSRADLIFSSALDERRDIDAECGYPSWLTPSHYRAMYDREGISMRVVTCEPEESWAEDPEVYEDENADVETVFEEAFKELTKKKNVWHHLQRLDILSGIGQYGVLLLGIDDGKDLSEPVDGINEDGTFDAGNAYQLTFLRPFDESVVFVKTFQTDETNPRYGQPVMYEIKLKDYPYWGARAGKTVTKLVHWTRVLHAADNRNMSEVFGVPRMQPVFNRLYDLRKIYSGSGEAYWKGAFPGLAFETDPKLMEQDVDFDPDKLRKELQSYTDGTQRYLATSGVTVKTLPPMVVDPTATLESHLKGIAIAKGIPYRILFGSEEARLASDQDARAWNRRVRKRQIKYLDPMIIRPFVDRMMAFGVLPAVEEYFIDWPDLNAPSDKDKADVANIRTAAMSTYISSGLSELITPMHYFTLILGMTQEEAQSIVDEAEKQNAELPEEELEPAVPPGEEQQEEEEEGQEEEEEIPARTSSRPNFNERQVARARRRAA